MEQTLGLNHGESLTDQVIRRYNERQNEWRNKWHKR